MAQAASTCLPGYRPGDVRPPAPTLRLRRLLGLGGDADRTAHAGATQPTIAHRVLCQILLVVVLGEIERGRVDDLGGDSLEAARLELLVVHRPRRFGGFALRRREHVDAGAIL